MRREGTKDRPNVNHLLDNIVMNGQYLSISTLPITINSVTAILAGYITINIDMLKKNKLSDIVFTAGSGSIGTAGLTVQLYDITNAALIGSVAFTSGQNNMVKTVSVKIYLSAKSGNLLLQASAYKTSAVGTSSSLNSTGLNIYAKLPGTNI